MAPPPVNGTTVVLPGAVDPVAVDGGGRVVVVGVGNGAVRGDVERSGEGVGEEAGVEEEAGGDDDGVMKDLTDEEEVEEVLEVLEERETGTVWPGLKPAGRVTPFWLAQVAGSSPWSEEGC